MKSHIHQCNICLSQLHCRIQAEGMVWDGVGLRHSTYIGHPTFQLMKVELADHHICGRCISGLRRLFSLETITCSESDTGNSPSSES